MAPASSGRGATIGGTSPVWAHALDGGGAGPRPRRTILVAEDDEGMRRLFTQVLREDGYRVLTARDGIEAVAVAGADDLQIDAIVADQVMPGASGDQVAERVRLRWTRIPVLIVSGYAIDARRLTARLGPRVAFLNKPFTPSTLLSGLRRLFAEAPPEGDLGADPDAPPSP